MSKTFVLSYADNFATVLSFSFIAEFQILVLNTFFLHQLGLPCTVLVLQQTWYTTSDKLYNVRHGLLLV